MNELYIEDPLIFWSCSHGLSGAEIVFLGVPFDGTSCFRVGSREAPNKIRAMSYNLETYCGKCRKDLLDIPAIDYGNVLVSPGNTDESLMRIKETVKDISDKFPVIVGGEHIITLPVVQALKRKHPKLNVLQFDAHLDLKDSYLGNKYSHVTVMKRISEILGKDKIISVGARSFSKDEMEFAKRNVILKSLERLVEYEIKGPVYVTIDMDIIDPSFAPGVSTPVSNGVSPEEFLDMLLKLKNKMDVVGFDIVETVPAHDNNNVTSLLAAEIMKTAILNFKE